MNYDILWYDMIYYDTLYVYILKKIYTYVTTFWLVSQRSWNTLCWFSHHWLVDSLVASLHEVSSAHSHRRQVGAFFHIALWTKSKLCFIKNEVKFRARWSCCSSRKNHAFCRTAQAVLSQLVQSGELQTHTATDALSRTFSIHGTRPWGAQLVQSWNMC